MIVNFNTGEYLRAVPRLARAASRRPRARRARDRQRLARRVAHRRRRGASVGPADREPRERLPVARVEPGHPGDGRPVRAAAEPRRRVVVGHARRLRARSRERIRARASWARWCATPTAPCTRAAGRFPSVVDAVGHAFLGSVRPGNRFTRRYHMDGWDRTTEREVDWVSGCCMLMPRSAFDEVGLLDEGFPLYGEELDIATRLRDGGWTVRYTPAVEIVHEIGVSTGRSRADAAHALRQHLPLLPQAPRRRVAARDPAARRGRHCGCAPSSKRCEEGSRHDEGRRPGRGRGHPHAPAHRDRAQAAAAAHGPARPRPRARPPRTPRRARGRAVQPLPRGRVPPVHRGAPRRPGGHLDHRDARRSAPAAPS